MGLFSPKIPAAPPPPPPPPAPPSIANPQMAAGLAAQQGAALAGAGFGGTIATSPQGAGVASTARPALTAPRQAQRSLMGG